MVLFNFIGVDIAKDKFDVALLLPNKKYKQAIFENRPSGFKKFVTWLGKYSDNPWVCLEATGSYSEPLADYLYEQEIQVSVENPLKIKNFAKSLLARNKNDVLDARIIAVYCQRAEPRVFRSRPVEQKATRELVQLIGTLKDQLIQLKNQLRSMLSPVGKKEIKKVIEQLEKQIKEVEGELKKSTQGNEEIAENLALLTSIKGIGVTSAYQILSYLPDLEYFSSAKQFAAFIGVTPRQCESGKMRGKTRLTKFGHTRFKKALYLPALVAKNHNEYLEPFVARLEGKHLAPKAIVGAVMRKLAYIIFGVLKSREPFNPVLACAP